MSNNYFFQRNYTGTFDIYIRKLCCSFYHMFPEESLSSNEFLFEDLYTRFMNDFHRVWLFPMIGMAIGSIPHHQHSVANKLRQYNCFSCCTGIKLRAMCHGCGDHPVKFLVMIVAFQVYSVFSCTLRQFKFFAKGFWLSTWITAVPLNCKFEMGDSQ